MKRLMIIALAALVLGCHNPAAPEGRYKMVTICTYTLGDPKPVCLPQQRCWYTYADNTYTCPSGTYTPANPSGLVIREDN